MYDICFFQKSYKTKKNIVSQKSHFKDKEKLYDIFESIRSKKPYVFNIETTNNCNMRCVMCPRTKLMTRPVSTMDNNIFSKVIDEASYNNCDDLKKWEKFIFNKYHIDKNDRNENAFYFYIIPRVISLHGFGEPVLDPLIVERIRLLAKKNIMSYFSCNPSNINLKKMEELFKAGLSFLKFSIDSMDDSGQKVLRGQNADFSSAYRKICELLKMKERYGHETVIVVTMIRMKASQDDEVARFFELWRDKNVYAYVKSQDNQWYFSFEDKSENKSHYAYQYCEFPWTSLTVLADGSVVPCTQDFNAEMKMGDLRHQSLEEIWNSKNYKEFRQMHINGNFPEQFRCRHRCDVKTISHYLNP